MEIPAEPTKEQRPRDALAAKLPKRAQTRQRKIRLLSSEQLDKRTAAFQEFQATEDAIVADLGGRDALSELERCLVQGFTGASVIVKHLNAQIVLGEEIAIGDLALAVSSMVRVSTRLGEARRQRVLNAAERERDDVAAPRDHLAESAPIDGEVLP